ncbi:MAG: aldo/keto reductase, partial [Planctomycetes bacterium]|nr:aldo/keto reductase [Planctomycetota bacterium]
MTLPRRRLGRTGLEVSALGLGAANLGGVYGEVDERTAIATVHRAFDLGVTLFDASPYYGDTRAETVLGKALATLPRDGYVLSTKAGRYGRDEFDFTPARLCRSLEESLRRLGVERVDLFLLHDVEFGDLDFVLRESLPAMRALALSGKVGHVGLTGLPLTVFRRALAATANAGDDTGLEVVLSYCHATLFDAGLLALLPELTARGIGVLNASAAAMGLLCNAGPRDWHPAGAAIRAACAAAAAHCRARGVELAELALSF